ncbi:hypothetical protein [Actinomadura sp. 9N407]|uniref:hypothetical protein n=1 Tax=Actinomadura sp. 9N407 TaxID=3375154 RepID=UPI0037B578B1
MTGYAVALPDQADDDGPTWYSGGRLAEDLTLPRLKQRWRPRKASQESEAQAPDLTEEERQAIYEDAAKAAASATAQIRRHFATNPHSARDAGWAASDALHVAAKATGNKHLRRAADAYDRAARPPYGRIPSPTAAGNSLRTAARLLALTHPIGASSSAVLFLVTNLVLLVECIVQLHRVQGRHAQEAAARTARLHLGRATPTPRQQVEWLSNPDAKPSPATLAMMAFLLP